MLLHKKWFKNSLLVENSVNGFILEVLTVWPLKLGGVKKAIQNNSLKKIPLIHYCTNINPFLYTSNVTVILK